MEPSTENLSPERREHHGAPVRSVPANAARPRSARRPLILLFGLLGLMIAGIGTYSFFTANEESTDDAQIEADVVPIGARVASQVLQVKIVENQPVKKGDLLVVLDDADYAARVQEAEAGLDTAKAQAAAADAQAQVVEAMAKGGLSSAKAMVSGSSMAVSSTDAQIAAARAGLLRAQAESHKAEIDLARAKELRGAKAIPQERLDNAQIADDAAQAALAQAQAQLAAAQESKRVAQSRVAEARGRLDQSAPIDSQIAVAHANADLAHAHAKSAEAALALAKLQLSYTQVLAPADGFVSKLSVHEGQLVQPGQPMVELVPAATYLVANFKETQIGRMKPGDRVTLSVDAFPGKEFEGRVESLSGGTGSRFSLLPADNASGNFVKVVQRVPVRIAWARPPEVPMRAGLSADVTVHLEGK